MFSFYTPKVSWANNEGHCLLGPVHFLFPWITLAVSFIRETHYETSLSCAINVKEIYEVLFSKEFILANMMWVSVCRNCLPLHAIICENSRTMLVQSTCSSIGSSNVFFTKDNMIIRMKYLSILSWLPTTNQQDGCIPQRALVGYL